MRENKFNKETVRKIKAGGPNFLMRTTVSFLDDGMFTSRGVLFLPYLSPFFPAVAGNGIGSAGAIVLAAALTDNTTLRSLNLDGASSPGSFFLTRRNFKLPRFCLCM